MIIVVKITGLMYASVHSDCDCIEHEEEDDDDDDGSYGK